jgi:uncharacterized protein
MAETKLQLEWLPGRYAVCRLNPDQPIPAWANQSGDISLLSITRTDRELSIVIDQARVPQDVKAQRDFVALRIVGVLDFSLIGILAKLTTALADAGVSVFVISTFETDVLLVAASSVNEAVRALGTVATLSGRNPFR